MLFTYLSWVGVACLTMAHVIFAGGGHKRAASLVSAGGAGLCLVSAAGLGIWALVVLNAVWIALALSGAQVIELRTWSRRRDLAAFLPGLLGLAAWGLGPAAVTWVGSATYLATWGAFSTGLATRREYLIACIVAGATLVPALLMMSGEAYATNEYLGMVIGLVGICRHPPDRRAFSVDYAELCV